MRTITVRPSAAWYSDDIDREKWKKTEIRKAPAQNKSTNRLRAVQDSMTSLPFSCEKQKKTTTPMSYKKIRATKRCCSIQSAGFFTGKLRSTTQMLANRFADVFHNKIKAIQSDLFAGQTPSTNPFIDTQACNAKLTDFEIMTEDQVKGLIDSSCLKTCNLDPSSSINDERLNGLTVACVNQDDKHVT